MHFNTVAAISALVGISTAVTCGSFSNKASVNNARTCADLLKGKGSQDCQVIGGQKPPQMCHQGNARVYGVSVNGATQSTTCQDVGNAVQVIIDQCQSGGTVSGSENAAGNPNISVQLHS